MRAADQIRGSEFITQMIGAFRDETFSGVMIVMSCFDDDDFRVSTLHDLED